MQGEYLYVLICDNKSKFYQILFGGYIIIMGKTWYGTFWYDSTPYHRNGNFSSRCVFKGGVSPSPSIKKERGKSPGMKPLDMILLLTIQKIFFHLIV